MVIHLASINPNSDEFCLINYYLAVISVVLYSTEASDRYLFEVEDESKYSYCIFMSTLMISRKMIAVGVH